MTLPNSVPSTAAEDRGLAHECGVFGIYAPNHDVAEQTRQAIYDLQHRGEDSAGVAVTDGKTIRVHTAAGRVEKALTDEAMAPLQGEMAIGHTRYTTSGSSGPEFAQPIVQESTEGEFALAHNGNLTNSAQLIKLLSKETHGLSAKTDSQLAALYIATHAKPKFVEAIRRFMTEAQGAYSMVLLRTNELYAFRDPLGWHPLALGKTRNDEWVVSSESRAFANLGAEYVRDVAPGEVVKINGEGCETVWRHPATRTAFCVFEYIYFSKDDSILEGKTVYNVRKEFGRKLATASPVEADMVVGVPDTAIGSAKGFAEASGIPEEKALIKNRAVRSFIQVDQKAREEAAFLKHRLVPGLVTGKRIVLIDDSIVRGTTMRRLVGMFREGGAAEVHVRISSPPVTDPCYWGVDMKTKEELISAHKSVEEVGKYIGADSLAFLSIPDLAAAIGEHTDKLCLHCLTGEKPQEVKDLTAREATEPSY